MIKHYVQFVIPGWVSAELQMREIPAPEHEHVSPPPNAIGYRFLEREVVQDGTWSKTSDFRKPSQTYFLVGEIKSLDDLRGVPGEAQTVRRLETNGYTHVLDYGGRAYPCSAADVVLRREVQ